jgi:hypothetical protein
LGPLGAVEVVAGVPPASVRRVPLRAGVGGSHHLLEAIGHGVRRLFEQLAPDGGELEADRPLITGDHLAGQQPPGYERLDGRAHRRLAEGEAFGEP